MKLTVLTVAYPLAPVRPEVAGGAEQIALSLDRGLVEAGHRSLVIACEGSRVRGELIAIPAEEPPFDEQAAKRAREATARAIAATLEAERIDLLHLHGLDFLDYLPPPGPPALVTLHLPPSWYPPDAFRISRPGTFLNPVSASQRAACPPAANLLDEIGNGVELPPARGDAPRRAFALTLARICPEKGVHLAIDAAAQAGTPLLIGGSAFPYPAHQEYFRREVAPRLGPTARLLGEVGPERKRRLLERARCLLAPSSAPETSSLAAMEALAAGAPVIAFPSGALPEIVEHGETGFLVRDAAEMAEAIGRAGEIEPERCRRAARERFSRGRMVERYFSTYRSLASQVELLTSLAELEAAREEWSELWRRTAAATPFQTPDWQIAWAQSFAPPRVLALAWRRGGRLAALLPLYVDEAGVARPLGVGVSDELDLLGDPEAAEPFLARLAEEGVERLDLPDLAPRSALAEGAAGWSCESFAAEPRSGLALPARLPSRKRRKLNLARNRAARLGGCAFESTGPEGLEWLFRLHAARWSSRGEQGVLADGRVLALHRAAAPGFHRSGVLRSYLLRIGGRPAGAFYGFCAHGRTYAYLSGMAPDLAYASPGALTVAHAIEEAAREGARWFDFLRGAEAFKQDWGAEARPGRAVMLRRRKDALAA